METEICTCKSQICTCKSQICETCVWVYVWVWGSMGCAWVFVIHICTAGRWHTHVYIHARICYFPPEGQMKICIVLVCACARNFVQQNRGYFDRNTLLIEAVSISRSNIWFRGALPLWCHSRSHMIIICADALKYSDVWKCMKMYENVWKW